MKIWGTLLKIGKDFKTMTAEHWTQRRALRSSGSRVSSQVMCLGNWPWFLPVPALPQLLLPCSPSSTSPYALLVLHYCLFPVHTSTIYQLCLCVHLTVYLSIICLRNLCRYSFQRYCSYLVKSVH